jgi:hypothetical protein
MSIVLTADFPETKSILMMMAAAWHRLAHERGDTELLVEDVGAAPLAPRPLAALMPLFGVRTGMK